MFTHRTLPDRTSALWEKIRQDLIFLSQREKRFFFFNYLYFITTPKENIRRAEKRIYLVAR